MRQALEEIKAVCKGEYPNNLKICKINAIVNAAITADDKERNKMQFTRINNDSNGNPRYVVHFLQCCPAIWKENDISNKYDNTCKLMNKIGGRKYHNKSYGGGIVFQSYSLQELESSINELKNGVK